MINKRTVHSLILATSSLTCFAMDNTNDGSQRYESFAIQMNLDDASADRVFDLGNAIYQGVNGDQASGKERLGRLFAVEEEVQEKRVVELKHKTGPLKDQPIIDKTTGKDATREFIDEKKKQHNLYLACEQTTASPHATITVFEDAAGGKLTADRVQVMHKSLDAVANAMAAQGVTCDAGMQLKVNNLVLIASFLNRAPLKDVVWIADSCPLRAMPNLKRTNVYYRLNAANELVDGTGGKFVDAKQDLARAFIVLECQPLLGQATGLQFLKNLNKTLETQADSGLKAKVYPSPLLHVTLAKLAGTKDSGAFRDTSRDNLLFPVRGCSGAFGAIQRLVVDANTSWLSNSKANGLNLLCDKLVVNPVQVSDGRDKPVLSFKPEYKRIARGTTNWSEQPRQTFSLLNMAQVAQPAAGRYVNNENLIVLDDGSDNVNDGNSDDDTNYGYNGDLYSPGAW